MPKVEKINIPTAEHATRALARKGWNFFSYVDQISERKKVNRLAVPLSVRGPENPEEILRVLGSTLHRPIQHSTAQVGVTTIVMFPEIEYTPHTSKIQIVDDTLLNYLKISPYTPRIIENADGRTFLGITLTPTQCPTTLGSYLNSVGIHMPKSSIAEQDGVTVVYWPNLPVEPSILKQLESA
jgi:hypothetical protein